MFKFILALSLTIAPALADSLTFSASAFPIEPTVYYGASTATLTVAQNEDSPILGVAAEVAFQYTWTATTPICPGPPSCRWSFSDSGNIGSAQEFSITEDISPSGNDVSQTGIQNGTVYLSAGTYQINLSAAFAYEPFAETIPAGVAPASITLTIQPIFGSISDAPEPATWVGVALALLCLTALSLPGKQGRSRDSSVTKSELEAKP